MLTSITPGIPHCPTQRPEGGRVTWLSTLEEVGTVSTMAMFQDLVQQLKRRTAHTKTRVSPAAQTLSLISSL